MIATARLTKIISLMLKHRLDLFVNKARLPKRIKIFFLFTFFLKTPEKARAVRLREFLEELGPIFVKFGQLLSTRPDLIPPDIAKELLLLQDSVPPFCSKEFKNILESSLGSSVEDIFKSYESEPMASASIAQVHAAKLKNGQDIVIKVVRPGIEGVIKKDLKLLYAIASLIERFGEDTKRLHPIEVVKEYENTIMGELDLKAEGANASVLKSNFEESDLLYIPRIYWEFSSKNVLVMDRIVGIPVTDVKKLKSLNVDFKLLAERGVEIFFTQVLHHNFFHADMHPGNIFVDASNPRSPTYIGIDCAIIGSLSNENQYYIARNLLAIFQRDYQLVAELHIQSGWVPKNTSVLALTGAVRTVCEPIFQRPLNEISLGHILIDLFATARDFQMEVQPALVLLQKTLLNIEGLGRQLYPELDLWNTAKPFLEQWLKDRYSPKSIIKKLKKNGPDIIEKISEVPMTLQEILQTLKNLDKIDGPSKNASSTNPKTNNEGKYVYLLIGLSLGVFGSYLLFTMSYW